MATKYPNRKINDRRYQILEFIDQCITATDESPTILAIKVGMEINSTSDIKFNIDRMEDDGWITSKKKLTKNCPNGQRKSGSIRLTDVGKEQLAAYRQKQAVLQVITPPPPLNPAPPANPVSAAPSVEPPPVSAPSSNGGSPARRPSKPIYEVGSVILSARISGRHSVINVTIPVLSVIAASYDSGQYSSDNSISAMDPESYLNINQDLLMAYRTEDLFALEVRGDSMIEAGIQSGDYVILKKVQTADNGDMCAIIIDGEESTLKYFYREEKRVRLEAANSSIPPRLLNSKHSVVIEGKVILVVRL